MRSALLSLTAAGLLVLAFPPYSAAWLVPIALALFLWTIRTTKHPFLLGTLFGWSFFAGLIYWIGELGFIAVAPAVFVFGLFPGVFAWLVGKAKSDVAFAASAVGGWAAMEALRVRFPVGGFEWGLTGYPMGEYALTRGAADLIGTSGWGVLLMCWAVGLVLAVKGHWQPLVLAIGGIVVVLITAALIPDRERGPAIPVAIVQGSTPCPLTHCLDERRATYEMHLAQTRTIVATSVDLVVWPEGSTGGFDADPVLNPEVGEEISAEAARIGAAFLVGGDRPISDTEWINAIVAWNRDGESIGEYRKRHPVPFGEYIPARPLFDWIPALSPGSPRHDPRGRAAGFRLSISAAVGTVISFEGAFARYGRDEAKSGAQLLVVASNEGSYEFTPVSDQFIGMTRMRAAELGLDVVHAAVTGKSTFITDGGVVGETADFLEETVISADLRLAIGAAHLSTPAGANGCRLWRSLVAASGSASESLPSVSRCRNLLGWPRTSPINPKSSSIRSSPPRRQASMPSLPPIISIPGLTTFPPPALFGPGSARPRRVPSR